MSKMYKQGSKPYGIAGSIIGRLMNFFHTDFYIKNLKEIDFSNEIYYLDIGCGGGRVIKELSKKMKSGKAYGLDHSDEMIKLAGKVNKKSISLGIVEIIKDDVSCLLFEDNYFNCITAFETIQFWQNTDKALKEINRVLKKDGCFVIINNYPGVKSKWYKLIKIKSDADYKNLLINAGFNNIDINFLNNKIIIKAVKS